MLLSMINFHDLSTVASLSTGFTVTIIYNHIIRHFLSCLYSSCVALEDMIIYLISDSLQSKASGSSGALSSLVILLLFRCICKCFFFHLLTAWSVIRLQAPLWPGKKLLRMLHEQLLNPCECTIDFLFCIFPIHIRYYSLGGCIVLLQSCTYKNTPAWKATCGVCFQSAINICAMSFFATNILVSWRGHSEGKFLSLNLIAHSNHSTFHTLPHLIRFHCEDWHTRIRDKMN